MSKAKQRLFVDCQVFQYNTWNRGMGRYSLKLLEAIDKEGVELILILNKNISLHKSRLLEMKKACPSAQILFLKLSEDPSKVGGWRRLQEICATELDKQLAPLLRPTDTYLIASNFALRYCSTFPTRECKKVVVFYDVTPYLQWADFKQTPDFEPKKYFAQFKTLFEADQLWAISQSAAEEAMYWLGIDARKVKNIRGASIRSTEAKNQKPPSAPDAPFLISPSADGPHKNNENMVRAFADFNAKAHNAYKLVITSDFSEQTKTALSSISPDLIFTGHVSDGELGWLYEHSQALLFVSKTEGLGLPILEAVAAGKKVICSEIKVFKEISDEAFYFADPLSVKSITAALEQALLLEEDWTRKKSCYADIGHKFSWPTVAQTCCQLMKAPNEKEASSWAGKTVVYADSDEYSLSRDIAELLYSMHQQAEYRPLRPFTYAYNYPSYLSDMGVARSVLTGDLTEANDIIYIVDDTKESAQLLLYALQIPGRIVMCFSEAAVPKNIETYVTKTFAGQLTFKKLVSLLQKADNRLIYQSGFRPRGTGQGIEDILILSKQLIEGE